MSSQISKVVGFLSSDTIFLLAVFVVLFGFIIYFGKGRAISLILAFYPAGLLFNSFPYVSKLIILHGENLILLNKLIIFLLFLIPLTIIIDGYIFSALEYNHSSSMLQSGGLALSLLILFVLFSYSTLNFDLFHNFSPTIDNVFARTEWLFWWNVAPLTLLAIF